MKAFDIDELQRRGFEGFLRVADLAPHEPPQLPAQSGVYVVVRAEPGPPTFLKRSRGGWWKAKDPTVPVERLEREWVHGAQTVYIGKAKCLRERVGELLEFADGRPVRHWGGRLLWQLERCEDLLLCWRVNPDFAGFETDLIDEFRALFGRLPFANLRRGDRRH
jgi:hypothetical protein